MATKAEWIEKIQSWVPGWFYQDRPIEAASISALAKVLADAEAGAIDEVRKTFIMESSGPYLSLHAQERSVEAIEGETLEEYRARVRDSNLRSKANIPALLEMISRVLIRGKATSYEDYQGSCPLSRGSFLGRRSVIFSQHKDTVTFLVDRQKHEPYCFVGDMFIGDSFVGSAESAESVFRKILEIVKENKAFGTLFRIVELTK